METKEKITNSPELRSETKNEIVSIQLLALVEDYSMSRIFTAIKIEGNFANSNYDNLLFNEYPLFQHKGLT